MRIAVLKVAVIVLGPGHAGTAKVGNHLLQRHTGYNQGSDATRRITSVSQRTIWVEVTLFAAGAREIERRRNANDRLISIMGVFLLHWPTLQSSEAPLSPPRRCA